MNIYAFLPLSAFLSNILLGSIILYRNPKDKVNICYVALVTAIAFWALGHFMIFIAPDAATALNWTRVSESGATIGAAFMLSFISYFSRGKILSNGFRHFLIYVPVIFLVFISCTSNLISKGAQEVYWGYFLIKGPLYHLLAFFVFIYSLISIFVAFRIYRTSPSPLEKKCALIYFYAFLVPIGFGVGTELIPPLFNITVIPLSPSATTFSTILIGYAVLKYRFMTLTTNIASESIVAAMADYLIVTDSKMNIVIFSDNTLQSTGYSRLEMTDLPLSTLFEDKSFPKQIFEDMQTKENIRSSRAHVLTKSGNQIPVSINGSTIKQDGGVLGFVLIMRDMTEFDTLIADLQKQTKELENSQKALEDKNIHLAAFNEMAVGREVKMVELKKQINQLQKELGRPEAYPDIED